MKKCCSESASRAGTAGKGVGDVMQCHYCENRWIEYYQPNDPRYDPNAPANQLYNPMYIEEPEDE